jgi:RimJ/RimL family protein N-acetyltransferase
VSAPLFQGELLRLAALNPKTDAEILARWTEDTEFNRLLTTNPTHPETIAHVRVDLEKDESSADNLVFALRTLSDDRLIGFIALDEVDWLHGVAFVGIGIGEREYWGRGYGADAMRLILRYAFDTLHLYKVTLDVFEYNQRAYRSYLKVGFIEEGRARGFLNRDGRRWDLIYMGAIREEWLAAHS